MSQIVKVRGVLIGEGIPKICVPLVGATKINLLQEAEQIKNIACDIVEWRVDCFEYVEDNFRVKEILNELRSIVMDKPILFTFRSQAEGGRRELSNEAYTTLLQEAIQTKLVDLVDIELFMGDKRVKEIIKSAHVHETKVLISNHDFHETPPQEEIIRRLCKMQELGADIAKMAVMPKSEMDVITLMTATREMVDRYATSPIVTMSMAGVGAISRLAGEMMGSTITFATAAKASAPGQLKASVMQEILKTLHEALLD